jgi:hypothetical protein
VIIQIFEWGSQIEWFEVYVLQEAFNLADFVVPTIMLTIFVTYVSSIVIVVVNLYREISKGLSRLTHMAEMGTPPVVVEEECVQLVKKMGSSIRIKFFMFLVILAGTTALTMDFLRSYSLGVIVLMPVVLLVIVPYVSSKMAKGVSKASEIMRTRREADSVALQSIADEDIEVVSPIEETLEEADKQPLEEAGEYESEASIEPDSIGAAPIPKRPLTKKELIDLIPPEVKDSVDLKELKKLSKKALEALIQPRDEDDSMEE